MKQVDDHVKIRLISQLIRGISPKDTQVSTTISTSFVLPSSGVFAAFFILDLNDSGSAKFAFRTSL